MTFTERCRFYFFFLLAGLVCLTTLGGFAQPQHALVATSNVVRIDFPAPKVTVMSPPICLACGDKMKTVRTNLDIAMPALGGYQRTNSIVYACKDCKETVTNNAVSWLAEELVPAMLKSRTVPAPAPDPIMVPVWTNAPKPRITLKSRFLDDCPFCDVTNILSTSISQSGSTAVSNGVRIDWSVGWTCPDCKGQWGTTMHSAIPKRNAKQIDNWLIPR